MNRRDKADGKPVKERRRKTVASRSARKIARRRSSSSAGMDKKLALITRERNELLAQQKATSKVLSVISGSQGKLGPVFAAMLESATRICEAQYGMLFLWNNGGRYRIAAMHGAPPRLVEQRQREPIIHPGPRTALARVAKTKRPIHIADVRAKKDYLDPPPGFTMSGIAAHGGARTELAVPLLKDDELVGSIVIYRKKVQPFAGKQIELLLNFAAQAVIAIENTRLFNELRQRTVDLTESLEQQIATSEVLKVISGSRADLTPVFDTIGQRAEKLCDAEISLISMIDGDLIRLVSISGVTEKGVESVRQAYYPMQLSDETVTARAIRTGAICHVPDVLNDPLYPSKQAARVAGFRACLAVPMIRDRQVVGAIFVARKQPALFADAQVQLLKTFADQAIIAIENVRLFNETKEALNQQTATADVLKVISRSTFDLQAVLHTLVESACRLCEADIGNIARPTEDGFFKVQATYGFSSELKELVERESIRADRGSAIGRALLERKIIHITDAQNDPEYMLTEVQKFGHLRTMLGVPLMREGAPIGVFALVRQYVQPFTEKQIELVTTFADQAAIAIENVRLFDEVQARTREVQQSLEYQTATSEILSVISRSPTDAQPVFKIIGERAEKLCDAQVSVVSMVDGELIQLASIHGVSDEGVEAVRRVYPMRRSNETVIARAVRARAVVHVPDVLSDSQYDAKDAARAAGYRACLSVPLIREGQVIGAIFVARTEPGLFADAQVQLLKTFADQAVIAIENVRLFEDVQARTRELSQSVDELRALGEVSQAVNSTLDLETVLTTIVGRAVQLSRTDTGAIYVFDEERKEFCLHATFGMSETMIAAITDRHIGLGDAHIGPAALQRRPIQVADIRNEPASPVNDINLREGYRGILIIPLLRPDHIVGALVVRRKTPGEFSQSTIDLLLTFADQSVVAVQNARLFESVEARTRELAKSLADLRTAQDRLVQTEKLASLGQLTAGIAHEIKNPLNFVNNFSVISVELIDELHEALAAANLDDKRRAAIREIADMLQGNLEKVVQHGKRADSIVKNMLLHSRQGSQEHRPVDINAVVEESLNLAYHGARAEKQGVDITLERSFDPTAGEVDVFPQEITRVLLNLISNGFYAAIKRQAETNGGGYEPTLAAATKNLGDSVEIRIRDNGTGIPPEVKERMFNPFFTTKPVGEGTGLGLSISFDIVVKQHGGSIEVDTQPGEFTEFRIVLPRGAATLAKSGDDA
jgi:GAF domain-containing protein